MSVTRLSGLVKTRVRSLSRRGSVRAEIRRREECQRESGGIKQEVRVQMQKNARAFIAILDLLHDRFHHRLF